MTGRNGADQLNRALLGAYIGLWVLRVIPVLFRAALLVRLCDVLMNVAAVLLIFRMLSRNLPARQLENQRWLNWQGQFLSRWRRLGVAQSVLNFARLTLRFASHARIVNSVIPVIFYRVSQIMNAIPPDLSNARNQPDKALNR